MKVVAILDRSAGNESVGSMWKETAIFELDTPVSEIFKWACSRLALDQISQIRENLTITIAADPK